MCCQPQSDFLRRINELPGGSKGCQACQFFRDHQTSCNCKKERFWEWWLVSTIWVGRNIKFIEQIFELDNPLKLQVTNASKCAPPNDNCPKNNRHWLTLLSSVVHSGGDHLMNWKQSNITSNQNRSQKCVFSCSPTQYIDWHGGLGGDIRAVLGSVPSKWSHCCCIDGNTTVYKMLLNEVYHDNAILYLKPNSVD